MVVTEQYCAFTVSLNDLLVQYLHVGHVQEQHMLYKQILTSLSSCNRLNILQVQLSRRKRFRRRKSFIRCTLNGQCSMKRDGGKFQRYKQKFISKIFDHYMTLKSAYFVPEMSAHGDNDHLPSFLFLIVLSEI